MHVWHARPKTVTSFFIRRSQLVMQFEPPGYRPATVTCITKFKNLAFAKVVSMSAHSASKKKSTITNLSQRNKHSIHKAVTMATNGNKILQLYSFVKAHLFTPGLS